MSENEKLDELAVKRAKLQDRILARRLLDNRQDRISKEFKEIVADVEYIDNR